MRIEVKQRISDYTMVDKEFKRIEATQKLSFGTWDDFQNWAGYMVEALEGNELNISVKFIREA